MKFAVVFPCGTVTLAGTVAAAVVSLERVTQQSPFVDQPIKRNGQYLTPNHLGSTATLTDSSGSVAEQYFYLPFGQTWQSAAATNPFQFTGRENDGTGFDFYRARYYSPDLGRFISEDPTGADDDTDNGDGNLYEYADGDPVNSSDPDGLWTLRVRIGPDGYGYGVVIADKGDRDAEGNVHDAGQTLLGPFALQNQVSGNHTWFPSGRFPVVGFRRGLPIKYGYGALILGGPPGAVGKWVHAYGGRLKGRPRHWWTATHGCIRTTNEVLKELRLLWRKNRRRNRNHSWHDHIRVTHTRKEQPVPRTVRL